MGLGAAAAVSGKTQVAGKVTHIPRLLIVSKLDGDFMLGGQIADSASGIVRRAVRRSALHVVSRQEVDATLEVEAPPPPPWPLADVRELGKQLDVDVTIDVAASRTPSGIRIRLLRIARGLQPVELPAIEATQASSFEIVEASDSALMQSARATLTT
jgi:hypothetical protein